jgi:flagellar assembly protein FliH
LLYPEVVRMKLFTKSPILKSTAVEITSPRVLESPNVEKFIKLSAIKGISREFPALNASGQHRQSDELAGEEIMAAADPQRGEQAQAIILEAKKQAEHIIAEAETKAAAILRAAEGEGDNIRLKVEETARNEVFPLARAEGYEQGLQEATQETERLRQQAKAYLETAQTILMDELHKADKELAKLCLSISERIIHAALNLAPERLLDIIRNLTLRPREKGEIKIHLSARDWEWYKNLPAEDKPPYTVIVDDSLKPGDSFIECAEGVFDAGIEVQLEKIEQYVFEELEHGQLDGFSQKD